MTTTLSRRGLLGTLLSLFTIRSKPNELAAAPIEPTRPWFDRANFERDGYWCDYVAWESWIYSRMESQAFSKDSCWEYEKAIDEMDSGTKIGLYCLMCDLADGSVSK